MAFVDTVRNILFVALQLVAVLLVACVDCSPPSVLVGCGDGLNQYARRKLNTAGVVYCAGPREMAAVLNFDVTCVM